jgi:hypothetical protein
MLPAAAGMSPLWAAVSILAHTAVTVAVVVVTAERVGPLVPMYIVLTDPDMPGLREFRMPALAQPDPTDEMLGESQGEGGEGEAPARQRLPITVPNVQISTEFLDSFPRIDTVFRYVGLAEDTDDPIEGGDEEGEGPIGRGRPLGPAYADGLLWIDPFTAALGIVGPSESRVVHVARVDAALRERIKSFIDSMPREAYDMPPATMWTTQVGEATWGMDQNWLYLGDFKVPSAVLALLSLLPLPDVDYERAKDARALAQVREDIIRTARAMDNADEFKSYVKQLRERKDRERTEAMEAARAKRDTVKPRPNGSSIYDL